MRVRVCGSVPPSQALDRQTKGTKPSSLTRPRSFCATASVIRPYGGCSLQRPRVAVPFLGRTTIQVLREGFLLRSTRRRTLQRTHAALFLRPLPGWLDAFDAHGTSFVQGPAHYDLYEFPKRLGAHIHVTLELCRGRWPRTDGADRVGSEDDLYACFETLL